VGWGTGSTQGDILIAVDQGVTRDEECGRFLLVRTGSLSCALPASDVVRVVRHLRCHAVPGSRSHLVGFAQYGGDPIPVLDLQVLMERGVSNARHQPTVILGRRRERGRSVLGLAVDEVLRVVDLPNTAVTESGAGLVGTTVEIEGEDVRVLNTHQLLQDENDDKGR
jgi:chemotaxis signal transduction protein